MPKRYSSKEIAKILVTRGFAYTSQKGSHVKYTKNDYVVIVPADRKIIPQGTLSSILRQAGLTQRDLKG